MTMKKRSVIGVLLLCFLCLCLFSACGGTDSAASVKIESADETISCKAPAGWMDVSGQLSDEASLEIANIDKEEYMIVLAEQKSAFDGDFNLQGYNKAVIEQVESAAEDVEVISEEKTELDGDAAAFLTKLSASVDDIRITYLICTVEWPEEYAQVVAWTSTEKAEEYDEELRSVIHSVHRK